MPFLRFSKGIVNQLAYDKLCYGVTVFGYGKNQWHVKIDAILT